MKNLKRHLRFVHLAVLLLAFALLATGCAEDGAPAVEMSTITKKNALFVPPEALETTLAPVRDLGVPGDVYMTAIDVTQPATGMTHYSFYVYQPEDTGESIIISLLANAPDGAIDNGHLFNSVTWTTHPGDDDESTAVLPDGGGVYYHEISSSTQGWYRLGFDSHAAQGNSTLRLQVEDYSGSSLPIGWMDVAEARVNVHATLTVGAESNTYFKGGAYRTASTADYAYIDHVTVDGYELYRRGFDQGQFNYPLGRLSAGNHALDFVFESRGVDSSYLWFGVNDVSFDPSGARTEWDKVQFLYQGAMHTGDYDAWNEGVAFAQGASLEHGVRPAPVRRGTAFAISIEDNAVNTPYQNAIVEVLPFGSETPAGWTAIRDPEGDYFGGIMSPYGYNYRMRETWNVTVPNDAPVGRYVVRAKTPWGNQLGPDVMFYVIHNPYLSLESGMLSKAELETYAYDEDEDGMPLTGDYGSDRDNQRDHFTAEVYPSYDGTQDYGIATRLTTAFRRTRSATAYSMLDYAMAVADTTVSEIDSMRRVFRLVGQRIRYTRPQPEDDASAIFGIPTSTSEGTYFTPEVAAAAGESGFQLAATIGGECFDYAFVMTAFARAMGLPARVVSCGSIGGFGNHHFAEVFLSQVPLHGGMLSQTGTSPADTDPWYVFDATDPLIGMIGSEFEWTTHGESIAPRAMYGKETMEIRHPNNGVRTPPWNVLTTDVDWTPNLGTGQATLPAEQVVDVGEAYFEGAEHWLTASGATGYIGFSDKDIYRVSKEATGATTVRVRSLENGDENLRPVLCIASADAPTPAIPEMCAQPSDELTLPDGESFVIVFNGEPNATSGDNVRILRGDSIQYELTLVTEGSGGCDAASAIDMGAPGDAVTIANDACLKVSQYPYWWGTRQMQLQNMSPGSYPVPVTWTNCDGVQGADIITSDWQSLFWSGISDACDTLIKLEGDGNATLSLRYYAM